MYIGFFGVLNAMLLIGIGMVIGLALGQVLYVLCDKVHDTWLRVFKSNNSCDGC